ncbi:hypothetical protein [Paenibacillus macerans]|uniref:hypothetical protein n=1 Tax=Paenibacillus macerans TaxID=44252 RepID=UPI00203DD1F0|nr:hypothetical protein [Paenibacillus macerans]
MPTDRRFIFICSHGESNRENIGCSAAITLLFSVIRNSVVAGGIQKKTPDGVPLKKLRGTVGRFFALNLKIVA